MTTTSFMSTGRTQSSSFAPRRRRRVRRVSRVVQRLVRIAMELHTWAGRRGTGIGAPQ